MIPSLTSRSNCKGFKADPPLVIFFRLTKLFYYEIVVSLDIFAETKYQRNVHIIWAHNLKGQFFMVEKA